MSRRQFLSPCIHIPGSCAKPKRLRPSPTRARDKSLPEHDLRTPPFRVAVLQDEVTPVPRDDTLPSCSNVICCHAVHVILTNPVFCIFTADIKSFFYLVLGGRARDEIPPEIPTRAEGSSHRAEEGIPPVKNSLGWP